jgi:hypothetical protein
MQNATCIRTPPRSCVRAVQNDLGLLPKPCQSPIADYIVNRKRSPSAFFVRGQNPYISTKVGFSIHRSAPPAASF